MIARIALVLTLVPVIAGAQRTLPASADRPEIVATGTAEVRLRPDRATLTVSVVVRNTSAAEAGRLNAERMAAVVASFRRQRIPDSTMATTGFSIEVEERVYDQPTAPPDAPTIYMARNSVRLELTDLEGIGRIVDSALATGASEIGGIAYGSSEAAKGRRRAIALAVAEARADAEAAAEAAGGRLGPLIELTLGPSFGYRGAAAAALYRSSGYAETSVLVPTNVVESATATVRFAFVARP